MTKIFRKEVLEKLQSPDRLNEMVRITSKRSWLSLAALAGLIIVGLIWAVMGEIPENVKGRGILIQRGGVIEVAASGGGAIRDIFVREGTEVIKGEVVASLSLPELEMQIENTTKKVNDLKLMLNDLESFGDLDIGMRNELLKDKVKLQKEIIEANEDQIAFYEIKIDQQKRLKDLGLITTETYMQTEDAKIKLELRNKALLDEMQSFDVSMFETKQKRITEENRVKLEIQEWERKLDELESLLELNGIIRSPAKGKVIELLANTGNQIVSGSVIMKIEQSSESGELEAITYVESLEGKKIDTGMMVKLAPSSVEVEEFGFIVAKVIYVSEYPSSYQGMLRILGNKNLAESFMDKRSPPIAVRLSLETDEKTPSGYKWTSGDGPKTKIRTGTICEMLIEVDRSSPLEILFVKFNRLGSKDKW